MFDYCHLDEIHMELTEKCNAACPMCGRFSSTGTLNPHLRARELDLLRIGDSKPISAPYSRYVLLDLE